MKILSFLTGISILLQWNPVVLAVCSGNLLIDDYSNFAASNTNSLGQYTSDDDTTTNIKADVADKKIIFTAKAGSYFYSNLGCETATTLEYNAVTFPVKGPSGGTLQLELQTSTSCSITLYKSNFYNVPTKMTGNTLLITVPLSVFSGANLNAIRSVVFESFTYGAWEIGSTQLVCANSPSGSVAASSISSPSPTSSSAASKALSSTASLISTLKTSMTSSIASSSSSSSSTKAISTTLVASTTRSKSTSPVTTRSSTYSARQASCTDLLVDDYASQSRLTFLFYNALLLPSSDDGTMKPVTGRADTATSVIVSNNRVTLTPANSASYFYTQFGCVKATDTYGGIGLTISAPAGTIITVELQTSSSCSNSNPTLNDVSSTSLGWAFDGTEKYYTIDFTKFPGLDTDHLVTLLFSGFTKAVTLGPIAFYCGATGAPYPVAPTVAIIEPSATIPATTGPSSFIIDTFSQPDTNNLGFYHGGDDKTTYQISAGKLTINTKGNSDVSWYSQIASGCTDFTPNDNGYVHIVYSGSDAFTIALQQHNPTCNDQINPFPFTWDSVEASRYSNTARTDIYVPLSHFRIDRKVSIGFALKGFYTVNPTIFSKIEIVQTVPGDFLVPSKLDTAPLRFACTRPNSFAFAIDDGDPQYAQQVISDLKAAKILVTFFTVGAALLDTSTNLTNVYNEMLAQGHQVAYHSFTHPPMEGLPSLAAIDDELNRDIAAVQQTLHITSTYFRPPFGTEGARVRQRLAALIPNAQFIAWSVDVQDYLWAQGKEPGMQVTAFRNDVNKGGNLVVCHYLYASTVRYLPEFIQIAQATGKRLMRVDQCMEDPNAPPL